MLTPSELLAGSIEVKFDLLATQYIQGILSRLWSNRLGKLNQNISDQLGVTGIWSLWVEIKLNDIYF